jgi:hypothetical protein
VPPGRLSSRARAISHHHERVYPAVVTSLDMPAVRGMGVV